MKPSPIFIIILCILAISLILYFAISLINNNNNNQSSQNNQTYLKNIEIIDGDTFKTEDGEIIRLLCVDTPEENQEGYEEASDFLRERLFYSSIRLEGNKTDKYGRSLRWVYADDVLVNKEIIDLGFGSLFEYDGENCSLVKD